MLKALRQSRLDTKKNPLQWDPSESNTLKLLTHNFKTFYLKKILFRLQRRFVHREFSVRLDLLRSRARLEWKLFSSDVKSVIVPRMFYALRNVFSSNANDKKKHSNVPFQYGDGSKCRAQWKGRKAREGSSTKINNSPSTTSCCRVLPQCESLYYYK